jgi:DNA polymerase-4
VAVVDTLAPVRQVLSIDEMECELTGRWQYRERAVGLAKRIKAEVVAQLGECMRTSVGIAPNTLLAKLASNMQKPDGLTVIEAHELPQRLYGLKPKAINGIGPRMVQRLERCGIHTMEQLYAAPRELLRTAWGGVAGAEMYDKLRGQWYGPRETVAKSLGHSHVLPPDLRNPAGAFAVLNRLTQKAAMRLRKRVRHQHERACALPPRVWPSYRRRPSRAGGRNTRHRVFATHTRAAVAQRPAPAASARECGRATTWLD